jgi:ornithine cyclodeaminase/alanine dehydrogenase-like protein (mu-crystallin family)
VEILILGHDDVTQLLPVAECIPLMRTTLAALSRGEGIQPLRNVVRPPGVPGLLALMPGFVRAGDRGVLGVKVLGIFGGNPGIGKDAHQGVVLLLDPETGEARAVVNASAITGVRTAAVSAVATDALARPDARVLTVLGSRVQAQWHVSALVHVRSLTQVRLTARDHVRGRAVAERLRPECATPIEYVPDVGAAVEGADIVVTATTAASPVLRRSWLAPGAHVNAVGACVPTDRELDTDAVADSSFYVDRRESALNESGDYRMAAAERGFGPEFIRAELGEVLAGTAPGRQSDGELTVFKSLGLAVEDLASAAYVVQAAARTGNGTRAAF